MGGTSGSLSLGWLHLSNADGFTVAVSMGCGVKVREEKKRKVGEYKKAERRVWQIQFRKGHNHTYVVFLSLSGTSVLFLYGETTEEMQILEYFERVSLAHFIMHTTVHAHRSCIYLTEHTVKTGILWNVIAV